MLPAATPYTEALRVGGVPVKQASGAASSEATNVTTGRRVVLVGPPNVSESISSTVLTTAGDFKY